MSKVLAETLSKLSIIFVFTLGMIYRKLNLFFPFVEKFVNRKEVFWI